MTLPRLIDAAENGNHDGCEALWKRYAAATNATRNPARLLNDAQVEKAIAWGKAQMETA
jgi:hypothetical protein